MREEAGLTGSAGSTADRFRALEAHPDLERLLAREPSLAPSDGEAEEAGAGGGMRWLAVLSVLMLGALATGLTFLFCAPLALVPVVLAVAGTYAVVRHFAEGKALERQPLRRVGAMVVEEGTSVGTNVLGPATYSVTLEAVDGSRLDSFAEPHLRGTLVKGAIGVAYLKKDRLIDFAPVDV